jgi:ATP diphosphatase
MTSQSFRRAHDLQASAATVGFDWPGTDGMLDKLEEELGELREALREQARAEAAGEELGDILFVLVNLARRLGLSPEDALDAASDKFERRFGYVRDELARRGLRPEESSLEQMEALWQAAKRLERR